MQAIKQTIGHLYSNDAANLIYMFAQIMTGAVLIGLILKIPEHQSGIQDLKLGFVMLTAVILWILLFMVNDIRAKVMEQ